MRRRVMKKISCSAAANSVAAIVAQAALELGQDRIARVAAHADDEGKAELRLVGIVQAVEARELLLRERVEPDARLLVPRVLGQRAGAGGLAGQVGMAAQEVELAFARRGPHRAHHRRVQRRHGGERSLGGDGFGDPGGQFERIADRGRRSPQGPRDSGRRAYGSCRPT